jgi:hypothetical protein
MHSPSRIRTFGALIDHSLAQTLAHTKTHGRHDGSTDDGSCRTVIAHREMTHFIFRRRRRRRCTAQPTSRAIARTTAERNDEYRVSMCLCQRTHNATCFPFLRLFLCRTPCVLSSTRYVIDLARAMPPLRPFTGARNAHLYRLFRPEFVRHYPTPLCPGEASIDF